MFGGSIWCMTYCTKCVMPDTKPGITFDSEGVCSACRANERKAVIDCDMRYNELKKICDKYRGKFGNDYDCIIAVSGGKDSHYQVHIMKEEMRMNPLLVTVEDNFPMTEAGKHNIRNISEVFGCDILSFKPNIKVQKILMRKTFEKYAKPTWYIDRLIYTYPIHIAVRFGIPLVVYGENVSYEYGGLNAVEKYSANDQIMNGVASDIPWEELTGDGVSMKDISLCVFPDEKNLKALKFDSIYMSYFVKWNSFRNYQYAKKRGFQDLTHEWKREHHIEDFTQVDSRGYLVHGWLRYPKFGYASATNLGSRFIRYGLLSREEAKQLVKEHDHKLDSLVVRDFCELAGYTPTEFWQIVDKFYNKDLFTKDENGRWVLKHPVWQES